MVFITNQNRDGAMANLKIYTLLVLTLLGNTVPAADDWLPPKTTRRYLNPPMAERMAILWSDAKISLADVVHSKDWHAHEYTNEVADACWFFHGADDRLFDVRAAKIIVADDSIPLHGLEWREDGVRFRLDTFCDYVRRPTVFGRVTIENSGSETVRREYAVRVRHGNEKQLFGGAHKGPPDFYRPYVSHPESWDAVACDWTFSSNVLRSASGGFLAFSSRLPQARWDAANGELRFAVELASGEMRTFDFAFGKGELVVPAYDTARSQTVARWQSELAKINRLPSALRDNPKRLRLVRALVVQMLQCFSKPVGCDYVLPRQGGLQRWVWPWDNAAVLDALTRIGDFGEYVEGVLAFYFDLYGRGDGYGDEAMRGRIGPFGIDWDCNTANVIGMLGQYCAATGRRDVWNRYRERALAGFRWIQSRRLGKEAAKNGWLPGFFPPGQACDSPVKNKQAWSGTDAHNITGIADFLTAAEAFDDPAKDEIRAVLDDYLAAMRARVGAFRDTGWKTRAPGYVLGLAVRFGFYGKEDVLRFWNACVKNGTISEKGLCANFPPRGQFSTHYWYTTSQDVFWHRAFRTFGRHDRADRILTAVLRYAMTEELCVGERYCDNDPWYLPWSPNASGSGRIIQMLLDASSAGRTLTVAHLNIGHFSNGVTGRIQFTNEAQRAEAAVRYQSLIGSVKADLWGLAEYSATFAACDGRKFATRDELFGAFPAAHVGHNRDGNCNSIFATAAFAKPQFREINFETCLQDRYVTEMTAELDGRRVVVAETHLDFNQSKSAPRVFRHDIDGSQARPLQFAQLLARYRDEPRVILMGDFNVKGDAEFDVLRKAGFRSASGGGRPALLTWHARQPKQAIDNVFVKGFDILEAKTFGGIRISDHLGVAVRLRPQVASGTLETASFQRAIDAASAAGGGRVVVPAGRHVVGQLDLRSNVELHLEKGAVLEGAVGMEHYRLTELPYSEGVWSAVVSAIGVTNVAITGSGEIYGNGRAWPQPGGYEGNQEGFRPRGAFFANSKDIRLEDFAFRDGACWGIVLKCCDGVKIRDLTISSHANANNDGIDVEAKNVVISGCDIDSSDDAIVLKSNDPSFTVENVLVTNCTVRSACCALKLGTASHGTMRGISFVDCRAESPRRDFPDWRPGTSGYDWFTHPRRRMCRLGKDWWVRAATGCLCVECVDGGTVEDVFFRNIVANGSCAPIFVRGGTRTGRDCGTPPSDRHILRNVLFENITGESLSWVASSITGVEGCRVGNVTLRNVSLVCKGAGENGLKWKDVPVPEVAGKYPDAHMFGHILPAYGLYARHVDGLKVENCSFRLKEGTSDSRPPVVRDDVRPSLASFPHSGCMVQSRPGGRHSCAWVSMAPSAAAPERIGDCQ